MHNVGIFEFQGGRHVDCVVNLIAKHLIDVIKNKNKNLEPEASEIRNHLWIFINCLIVNPTFDSQIKEKMTLDVTNFSSECTLSDKFFAEVNFQLDRLRLKISSARINHTCWLQVSKLPIMDAIICNVKAKELQKLNGNKTAKLQGICLNLDIFVSRICSKAVKY